LKNSAQEKKEDRLIVELKNNDILS